MWCVKVVGIFLVCVAAQAATLQRLTLDDLSANASQIVYGPVTNSYAVRTGDTIQTHYQVSVQQRWKGAGSSTVEVVLPGGVASGARQSFAGVPALQTGKAYLMYLWAGKSGVNQLLGLTQGLFNVTSSADGTLVASRTASAELMLDAQGKKVQDQSFSMPLKEMNKRVQGALQTSSATTEKASR